MRLTFVRNARKDQQVMDFELPEEHQLAYESAFAFARDEIRPHNAEIERSDDFPRWMWQRLADQGYTGIAIPEEYGGSDGDFLMAALVSRGIGRANGAIAMSFGAHLNLCAHNILRNGTEEQKQRYLPRLASTEMIGALGLTEPNAGSDAMGIQATARPTNGGYLLNGTKCSSPMDPLPTCWYFTPRPVPRRGVAVLPPSFLKQKHRVSMLPASWRNWACAALLPANWSLKTPLYLKRTCWVQSMRVSKS